MATLEAQGDDSTVPLEYSADKEEKPKESEVPNAARVIDPIPDP